PHRHLHSFPTRRSSDLRLERLIARVVQSQDRWRDQDRRRMEDVAELPGPIFRRVAILILVVDVDAPDEVDDLVVLEASRDAEEGDRKSTRLNSSHVENS